MPKFGKNSKIQLLSCDERLQIIAFAAIEIIDFSVICGYRSAEDQQKLYEEGKTPAQAYQSKHNVHRSLAVDIAPYYDGKIQWEDREAFFQLAGIWKGIAHEKKINIKWGGDFKNQFDGPHFELIGV